MQSVAYIFRKVQKRVFPCAGILNWLRCVARQIYVLRGVRIGLLTVALGGIVELDTRFYLIPRLKAAAAFAVINYKRLYLWKLRIVKLYIQKRAAVPFIGIFGHSRADGKFPLGVRRAGVDGKALMQLIMSKAQGRGNSQYDKSLPRSAPQKDSRQQKKRRQRHSYHKLPARYKIVSQEYRSAISC